MAIFHSKNENIVQSLKRSTKVQSRKPMKIKHDSKFPHFVKIEGDEPLYTFHGEDGDGEIVIVSRKPIKNVQVYFK